MSSQIDRKKMEVKAIDAEKLRSQFLHVLRSRRSAQGNKNLPKLKTVIIKYTFHTKFDFEFHFYSLFSNFDFSLNFYIYTFAHTLCLRLAMVGCCLSGFTIFGNKIPPLKIKLFKVYFYSGLVKVE